ncbi:MAG TPA: MotA/TolQ/ExbB proton channel family protein, partial [Planctomycetota bacterium]|nr:MotA/TolQ/ExbB proton channel family protein [Planctomycetota bacterium]
TRARDAARSERETLEAGAATERAARARELDARRAELLETLAKAEAAEAAASDLAAAVEADAFAVEALERDAAAAEAEAAGWRDALARKAAELGVVEGSAAGAGIVDAAIAAATERARRARDVAREGDLVRVGALGYLRAAGGDRAFFQRDLDDEPRGPFPAPGLDAWLADLDAGRPIRTFYWEPVGRPPLAAATDASFAAKVRSGGPIAAIILALGAVAALGAGWRAVSTLRARPPSDAAVGAARAALDRGEVEEAVDALRARGGATHALLAGFVADADPDRDAALDRLALRAESSFARLQSFFAVVAAVAPLLGLLGTITGMIKTFAALRETGGGDVRALSDGIAEALITTELGLWVAIPMLLAHALLGARARRLADDLEDAAVRLRPTAEVVAR